MEMKKKYDNMTNANIEKTKEMLNITRSNETDFNTTPVEPANIPLHSRPAALIDQINENTIR